MSSRCVAVLGGSFDPVHNGHVALARLAVELLQPDELRIIPAGNPWQKTALAADNDARIAMLRLAFAGFAAPVVIDEQEVRRSGASYTIDTLQVLRAELGSRTSVVFIMGADQIQRLHTWRDWQRLLDYAHLFAASRPGYAWDAGTLDPAVTDLLQRHAGTLAQLRTTPHGKVAWSDRLAVDISATEVRALLCAGAPAAELLPHAVLDYIQQQRLYRA